MGNDFATADIGSRSVIETIACDSKAVICFNGSALNVQRDRRAFRGLNKNSAGSLTHVFRVACRLDDSITADRCRSCFSFSSGDQNHTGCDADDFTP